MLFALRNTLQYPGIGLLILGVAHTHAATPTQSGLSGYINMPSAVVEADGNFGMGYSYDRPYGTLWINSTILPFLQVNGRFVSVSGIPGFQPNPDGYGSDYGRYKDKVVDTKLRLWQEGAWYPGVAVGATDLFGTELFKGQFIAATKTFGATRNIEATVGYGRARPDGLFAGLRWRPAAAPRWAAVVEYDANDYASDYRASETVAGARRGGPALGLEYRWGWLGAQVTRNRDHFSANVFASIPLSQREFIPKIFEPGSYQPKMAPVRLSAAQWQAEPGSAGPLLQALAGQNFKNVRVVQEGGTLKISLTNNRMSEMGRAVGRAARTALWFAPLGTRTIHITYTKQEQPIATYEFIDLAALTDYLSGLKTREAFLQTALIRYSGRDDRLDQDRRALLAGVDEGAKVKMHVGRDGNVVQLSSEDREDSRFQLAPKLGFFFNDPSGALRYDLSATANYDKRLGNGLYFNSALRLSVYENISGVEQESNSLLPHVRTDVAEFKRGGRFKLNKLMVNQYFQPAERWYGRLSGGFYEEMYRGFGGQVLYLPRDSRWAADVSVDALEQRGFKGWFDKRDYRAVTAVAAMHYRLPYEMTGTARVGQFLARDQGVRFELKRRFRSGIEVGAWFTKTDGKDITSPGTPSNPYNDKGIFMSIPLNSMLPSDSQATAGFSLAPWTRDVGQMVASPGDLYDMIEQPRRDLTSYDGLGNFAERPDEQDLDQVARPVRGVANPWPMFRARLRQSAASAPSVPDWTYGTAAAGGVVLASALLDKPVDRFVRKHQDARLTSSWGKFGKNMPYALVATAGIAVAVGDERLQNTGIIALQSVVGAAGTARLGKYAINRARPEDELGAFARTQAGSSRSGSAFPSTHAAVAFAAVTPFAQEYDAPWLYGVAAVSSMGRIANRKHWVSDAVAGGVIGYAIGSLLWQGQRDYPNAKLSIVPGNKEISVAWQGTY